MVCATTSHTIYLFPAHPHPPTRFSPTHLLRRCSFGGFFLMTNAVYDCCADHTTFAYRSVANRAPTDRATGSESGAYLDRIGMYVRSWTEFGSMPVTQACRGRGVQPPQWRSNSVQFSSVPQYNTYTRSRSKRTAESRDKFDAASMTVTSLLESFKITSPEQLL